MRFAWILAAVTLFAAQLVAGESYIFKRAGLTRMHSMDVLENERAVQTLLDSKEDFLWIRYNGREYVVRDARTLAEIDAAFEPMRAMSGEKGEVKARVRPLRQRVKAIDRQLRREDDSAMRARLERERDNLQRELETAEDELRRVGEKKQQLGREADAKMLRIFERALRSGLAVAQ